MPPIFSIVMPTFNRRETLEKVLPTYLEQDFPAEDFEILLSDSGSSDGTREMIEAMNVPNLRFLVGENRGRSGARNRGIDEARGEIILFSDADILGDRNLLKEHRKFHEKYPGSAVVGCEVQVNDLAEYERARQNPETRRNLHQPGRKTLPWLYFLTGNASVSRSALIEVGKFDESFTGYGHEDLELGYRLQKKGIEILYNPGAINYHWHPVGFEEKCEKMRLAGISTIRFYNKHKDPKIKLLYGVNPLSMTLHSLISLDGWLMHFLKKKKEESHLASEIILQYHYLDGVKEGMRSLKD